MDDDVPRELGAAARSVWAKTERDKQTQQVVDWMPLWRHLDDTAAVAERLWEDWMPRSVRAEITRSFDDDDARAGRLVRWLAGIHDVGKASPAFAVQYPEGLARMTAHGLVTSLSAKDPERRRVRHELAGHLALVRWLGERHGWRGPDADRLAVVVGGHHGTAPDSRALQAGARMPDLLGDGLWVRVQDEYLDRQAAQYLDDGDLRTAPLVTKPVQVLMTALVIIADWVASNQDLFPCRGRGPAADRADHAWRCLSLPRPWQAKCGVHDANVLLQERFGRSGPARPIQTAAVEAATSAAEPGLIVVEAPMGEGKTEAALMAAEILAARTGAGGCFLALPTQATSDAMFTRVRSWMSALPGDEIQSVFLAHGKASLNDEYQGIRYGRGPVAVALDHDDDALARGEATGWAAGQAVSAVVHQWFSGRKKGVLASFVVGTVDQLLFLALKSRHLVLRHLALAGKVVVIDEVHAYDVYMGSYLDRALHWLGAYGVPVVLLSATLPGARRAEMIEAYRAGQAARAGGESTTLRPDAGSDAYPLITYTDGDQVTRLATEPAGRATQVSVQVLSDGDDRLRALGDRLAAELAGGGCALVVQSTVTRVMEVGRYLTDRFGADQVTVTHARFLAVDRAENDRALLQKFGPPGPGVTRPPWHVVVGSQVVEQSLDIDFDLLITDLAPVDLVLQRMGRLHRHRRGAGQAERPERLRRAQCLVTGLRWTDGAPELDRGSEAVYARHPLLRSAAVLLPHLQDARPVELPVDIAPLVQRAYGPAPAGPTSWQPAVEEAAVAAARRTARRRDAARTFQLGEARGRRAILGWVSASVGEVDDGPQGEAQVRDGEMSLEVLAVLRTADGLVVPSWVRPGGGRLLDEHLTIDPRQARLVAACAVRLPVSMTGNARLLDQVIGELEADFVSAWQQSPLLAGQLVLVLDYDGRRELAGHQLHYTRALGLEVTRS